jgi:hypothetical protein
MDSSTDNKGTPPILGLFIPKRPQHRRISLPPNPRPAARNISPFFKSSMTSPARPRSDFGWPRPLYGMSGIFVVPKTTELVTPTRSLRQGQSSTPTEEGAHRFIVESISSRPVSDAISISTEFECDYSAEASADVERGGDNGGEGDDQYSRLEKELRAVEAEEIGVAISPEPEKHMSPISYTATPSVCYPIIEEPALEHIADDLNQGALRTRSSWSPASSTAPSICTSRLPLARNLFSHLLRYTIDGLHLLLVLLGLVVIGLLGRSIDFFQTLNQIASSQLTTVVKVPGQAALSSAILLGVAVLSTISSFGLTISSRPNRRRRLNMRYTIFVLLLIGIPWVLLVAWLIAIVEFNKMKDSNMSSIWSWSCYPSDSLASLESQLDNICLEQVCSRLHANYMQVL